MERKQIRFSGRVQGVGFRATTRWIAETYDITGWVRNEPDGAVHMEIQGEPAELDRCLRDINDRLAEHIDSAESRDAEVVEGETGYEIRF